MDDTKTQAPETFEPVRGDGREPRFGPQTSADPMPAVRDVDPRRRIPPAVLYAHLILHRNSEFVPLRA